MSSPDDPEQELDEEAEDILGLADIIGIGRSEQEYLWIAKEAYNADLPGGWEIFFDEEGNHFYFDAKKQISTYTHPSIDYYRKLYKDFKQKDREFREQQERREIAFGLREEAAPDRAKLTGGEQEASSRAASPEREHDEEIGEEDDGADEDKESLAKTRLLQAFSHDPNLASKFRKDIKEQEGQASAILKRSLEKEEENFVRHLRVYVNQKQESVHGPLEALLHSHTAAQQAKIEDATSQLTEQITELKKQALAAVEEASKAAAAAAQKAKSSSDEEARQRRMKAMQPPKTRRLSQDGAGLVPIKGGAEQQERGPEEGGVSPVGWTGECDKCKASEAKAAEVQAELDRLVAQAKSAQGSEGEWLQLTVKLSETAQELTEAKEREETLRGELAKLKTVLAQTMMGELSAAQHREQMEQLADEARRLDAQGPPPAPPLPSAHAEQAQEGRAEGEGELVAERLAESGVSPSVLMDILERMEAMAGGEEGPIQAVKKKNQSLMAKVEELEVEKGRWIRHAEELEAENSKQLQGLAQVQALQEEVQRKAAHSEHMEFLAQQYSDQVQSLQGQLRKLRDEIAAEQSAQTDAVDRARRLALATSDAQRPAHQPVQTGALAAKAPFAVRVRSSTILAVKRSTHTLRAAVNLLRIDFQAYAEGIFLPLARELQRNTLVLSTSLSERSRELRLANASMSTAIQAQRLLEGKLRAVYSVSFHTLAYLRRPEPQEQNQFREPQPRSLTMMLKAGFEGKREVLESYDFEKVFGPDVDPAGIFQELAPFLSRVINWQSACLLLQGGRNSGKRGVALGADYVDESGRSEEVAGVLQQAVHFMAHVYQEEQMRILKAKQQDVYDLNLFLELSEVVDDGVVHYMQGGGEEDGGGGGGARRVSLFDVQNMLSSQDKEEEEAGGEEGEQDGSEVEQEAGEAAPEAEGREAFVPSCRIENAADGERRLAEALKKSEGRAQVRQQEVERGASERVARARRLAKPGSRNALGELAQEGHYVLSIMMVKRERATEERQVGLLKVVMVGSAAETEDTGAEKTAFKKEQDQSTYTLQQFLEKKYLRETKLDAELAHSPLSELIWDCLAPEAAVVLLTSVSPGPADFEDAVHDLRFACTATRARPSTASRLERVKYRWQNQSVVWAFTLWRGAVADSERIQLANQLSNQQEENAELRQQTRELQDKLEEMANKGIEYASGGESEPASEDEFESGRDELYQQKLAIERIVGKEMGRIQEKSDAVLLQAMTAKLGFSKDKTKQLAASNRALSRLLAQQRAQQRAERPTKMPKLRGQARSATPQSAAPARLSPARDLRGVTLPPATRSASLAGASPASLSLTAPQDARLR